MSSFSERAGLLRKVRSTLRRKFGKQVLEPVDDVALELLQFILLEESDQAAVGKAIRRVQEEFADLNEVRVSFPREIAAALPGLARIDRKAARITRMFNAIFLRHNTMNWDFFRSMGVRELRQYFEKVDGGNAVLGAAAVMLLSAGHAVPADADLRRVMGRLGLAKRGEDIPSIQAFLERALRRDQGYEMWALLHRLGESVCQVTTPQCGRCLLSAVCPTGRKRLARKKKAAVKKTVKTTAKSTKTAKKAKVKKAAKKTPKKATSKTVKKKAAGQSAVGTKVKKKATKSTRSASKKGKKTRKKAKNK